MPHAPDEDVRDIRAAVFSGTRTVRSVLHVTGLDPRSGQAELAARLAESIAMAGRTVLLVDRAPEGPPLSAFLAGSPGETGDGPGSPALADGPTGFPAATATGLDNLWLLTGRSPDGRGRIDETLEAARPGFNYVVVLGPPLSCVSDLESIPCGADGLLVLVDPSVLGDGRSRVLDLLERAWEPSVGIVTLCGPGRSRGPGSARARGR